MKDFKERIKNIDNGIFVELIDALDISNTCEKCYYFNPAITDIRESYRCNCLGSCPAATLSDDMQKYIWDKVEK